MKQQNESEYYQLSNNGVTRITPEQAKIAMQNSSVSLNSDDVHIHLMPLGVNSAIGQRLLSKAFALRHNSAECAKHIQRLYDYINGGVQC